MAINTYKKIGRDFVFFFLMMAVVGLLSSCTIPDITDEQINQLKEVIPGEVSRVQHALGGGSMAGFTTSFNSRPAEGNLLVAISGHRLQNENPVIAQPGWTLHHIEISETHDNNLRRGIAVWSKIAGSGESKDFTINWNGEPSRDGWVILQEFSGVRNYEFYEIYGASSEGVVTSLNIPDDQIVFQPGFNLLTIAGLSWRDDVSGLSFDDKYLGGVIHNEFVEPQRKHVAHGATGFNHLLLTESLQTTASWTDPRVATGFLIVFKLR
jgi:hypothetical protein